MKTISQTAEAVKYFEMAIEEMKDALYQKIEQDEEYLAFKQKFFGKHNCTLIYFKGSMEFEFYSRGDEGIETFFRITKTGEIEFNDEHTFEGIEKVATEAQRITQKYFKEELKNDQA